MQTLKRILEAIVAGIVGAVLALSVYYVYLDRSGALRAQSAECEDSEKPISEKMP